MSDTQQNMAEIDAAIIADFEFLDDWLEKYQQIMDEGKKLAPLAEDEKTEAHYVDGCQSQVWMVTHFDGTKLHIRAESDAAIVSGLIALLLRLYSGQPPQAILSHEPRFIPALELEAHLSPTRKTGLAALMDRIRMEAQACITKQEISGSA